MLRRLVRNAPKPTLSLIYPGDYRVLQLAIPNQLDVDYNLHILESFATHVAPALGWEPNTADGVTGKGE